MRLAIIVALAFLLVGCAKTSLSVNLETGEIGATVKTTGTEDMSATVAGVRQAMQEACEANDMTLGPGGVGFVDDLSKLVGVLMKLIDLLPSQTVTLEGRCV